MERGYQSRGWTSRFVGWPPPIGPVGGRAEGVYVAWAALPDGMSIRAFGE